MKTTHKEIIDYWVMHEDECGLGIDWSEAAERCWRCGYKAARQRCHIIPDCFHGCDDPSNLVLLCSRCHREAPNIADPRFMWIWMRRTCVPFYDMYWTQRGVQEFEIMFGRKPFTGTQFEDIQEDEALKFLKEEMQKTTHHFGEGRLNPSTIACILALIEERVCGEIPVPGKKIASRL